MNRSISQWLVYLSGLFHSYLTILKHHTFTSVSNCSKVDGKRGLFLMKINNQISQVLSAEIPFPLVRQRPKFELRTTDSAIQTAHGKRGRQNLGIVDRVGSTSFQGIKTAAASKSRPARPFFASPSFLAKKFQFFSIAVLLLGLLAVPPIALAQTPGKMVANLDQSHDRSHNSAKDRGTRFTTGHHDNGYRITSVEVDFVVTDGTQPTYTMEIWSAPGSQVPVNKVGTLVNPDTLVDGVNTFVESPDAPIVLEGGRSDYVLVWDVSATGTTDVVKIKTTNSDHEDGETVEGGWLIAQANVARDYNTSTFFSGGQDVIRFAVHGYTLEPPRVEFANGEINRFVPIGTDSVMSVSASDPDGGTEFSFSWKVIDDGDNSDKTSFLTVDSTDDSRATFNATFDTDTYTHNDYRVVVTARDDDNTTNSATLSVVVTTEASRDSSLTSLVLKDASDVDLTLSPTFDTEKTEYKTTLTHTTRSVKVFPTTSRAYFSDVVLRKPDGSDPIRQQFVFNSHTVTGLLVGENIVSVGVGSQDGSSFTDYNVVVKIEGPPTAAIDPSTDQSVQAGTDLALTGSGEDTDGGDVTFTWAVTDSSDMAVTGVLTVNSDDPKLATFNGSAVGTYTVTLTVTDDESVTAEASIDVTVTAAPPTASITPSGTLNVVTSTDQTLTGSGEDPDGGTVSYAWTASDGTNTVTGTVLTGTTTATTTFNAATAGTYTVTLTVTDDEGATATDSVTVEVAALVPPTASITPSGTATVQARVDLALTGAGTDPDGGTVSFAWAVTDSSDAPVTGVLTVSASDSKLATFNAPTPGTYTVTLTVTDNESETTTASLTVTVTLPDEHLVITPRMVSVDEDGGTDSWTVKLNTQPTGTVTVAIASGDTSVATVSPSSLTFTTTDWSTAQPVTATGVDDTVDNATDRMTSVSHTASGADYGSAAPVEMVTVTAVDNDDPGLRVSKTALSVAEAGGTDTWTVRLDAVPTGTVTVAIASGATSVATVSPASLTFTTSDWSTEQTVTVTGVNDDTDNTSDRTAMITHTASGGNYGNLTATVTVTATDDDERGVTVTPSSLFLREGDSASFTVSLNTRPSGAVNINGIEIALTKVQLTGARSVTLNRPSVLILPGDWKTSAPSVLVSVANDPTAEADSTVRIAFSVSGGDYEGITVPSIDVTIPGYSIEDMETSFLVPANGMVTVPDNQDIPEAVRNVQLQFTEGDMPTISVSPADAAEVPQAKPRGFMAGDHVVDIQVTSDAMPSGPVIICLPQEGGGWVYRWDDQATNWVALDLPGDDFTSPGPDFACGVTNEFSLFAVGEAPPGGVASGSETKARLAQLGRVVAGQAVDAVQNRLSASREAGFKISMAGQALPSFGENSDVPAYASSSQHDLGAGFTGTRDWENTQIKSLTEQSLLSGSSFTLTDQFLGAGTVSVWGQTSITGFDGEGLDDGQLTSGFFGADWSLDELTAGLALSLNRGKGTWTSDDEGEDFRSSVTGIHPYFGYELSNSLSVWGVAGYGEGDIETMNQGETISVDTDMLMVAGGTSGDLETSQLPASITDIVGDDVSLTLNSDVLWVRMGTDAEDASASRLRVAVEASSMVTTADGIKLKPMAEVGLRFDGGDAETGFGLDIGGGVGWSDASRGVSAELRGRALLTHASDDLREQSISGSFGWDPNPASSEGANLTVSYTIGDSATGGTEALFARDTLSAVESIGDGFDSHRMEIRLGYGMPVWSGRFIGTPQTTFGYSDDERDVSLGLRIMQVDRSSVNGTGSLNLSVEARRSENASDGYRPQDEIVFSLRTQF